MLHLVPYPTLGSTRRTVMHGLTAGVMADDLPDTEDTDEDSSNETSDISQNEAYSGGTVTPASSTGNGSTDSSGLMSIFGSDAAANILNAAATYATGAASKPVVTAAKVIPKTTSSLSSLSKIPTWVWLAGAAGVGAVLLLGKKR